MLTDSLLLLGAGGHGNVVADALSAAGSPSSVTVADENPLLFGGSLLGRPIEAPVDWDRPAGTVFHVAIGHNGARALCHASALSRGWVPWTIIHPAASVSLHAEIGIGSFIAAQAIVAPAARVGESVIVNHAAVVDHDCKVGDFCHIGPGAVLGGGVAVGREVLIGARAVVLPGRTIGNGATVGAGAVVTHDVAANDIVIGVPARPVS